MPYQFNPLTGNFDIVNPQLTGSEIKTLYEGEDNTNAFTDEERSKLAALDSDDYVQLTGNQTITGIKTFTEKLLLPNCTFINGVAHFYQTTIPTQRIFLVNDFVTTEALVVGDRWYKPSQRRNAYWDGTNWCGDSVFLQNTSSSSVTATRTSRVVERISIPFINSNSAIVRSFEFRTRNHGTLTADNNWNVSLFTYLAPEIAIAEKLIFPLELNLYWLVTMPSVNYILSKNNSQNYHEFLYLRFTKIGNAPSIFEYSWSVEIQPIYTS